MQTHGNGRLKGAAMDRGAAQAVSVNRIKIPIVVRQESFHGNLRENEVAQSASDVESDASEFGVLGCGKVHQFTLRDRHPWKINAKAEQGLKGTVAPEVDLVGHPHFMQNGFLII